MLSSNLRAGSTNPPPVNPSERDNTVAITEVPVPAATPVASSNSHQVTIGMFVMDVYTKVWTLKPSVHHQGFYLGGGGWLRTSRIYL